MMNEDALMRGYCAVLDSCETRSRDELWSQHLIMLERLCRHARDTTPFYSDRLKPLFGPDDGFRFDAWPEIPPLTRLDVQEQADRLTSCAVPSNFGASTMYSSSGSTGQPVRALWTDTQRIAMLCVGRRLHRWHGIDPTEFHVRIYTRSSSDAPETVHDHWSRIYKALGLPGRAVKLNGHLPVQHLLERLEALQPQHLNAYPRLLMLIASEYLLKGQTPSFALKSICTFGETRTEAIDNRLMQVFGVLPHGRYTTEEVGHIAIQCPDCRNYHVAEEVIHLDVTDEELRPVSHGAIGRALTTPLYSYAMPLIRYEVGDEVRLCASDCPRSQGTSISEIIGRMGDMFFKPDGQKFRPDRSLLPAICDRLGALAAQVVQEAHRRLQVNYHARQQASLEA